MATVRKGSRRSKEAQITKDRFTRDQKISDSIATAGSLMATNQQNKRNKLKQLKKDAYDSNEMAERIAAVKKTGGKDIDSQVLEQITARGNELAQAHIKAYGPDGSPEMISEYTKQKAQVNKDLDDLTMFIGTLDAELEARDKAIDDGTFIEEVDEDGNTVVIKEQEQFKNGIFNGSSNVNLTYDPDGGGYSIADATVGIMNLPLGAMGATGIDPINLGEYAENLRKNGTSYKAISPNAEGALDQYGMNLIGGLESQMTDVISNVMMDQPNPNFNDKLPPDPKTNPKTVKAKTGYKSTNIDKAKDGLTKALMSQSGFKSFKNSKGQPMQLPPENQMWAQLQNAGYIDDIDISYDLTSQNQGQGRQNPKKTVSWSRYNNPDKENVLKQAYANYLIDTQFQTLDPDGEEIIEDTKINFSQGKVPTE